MNHTRLASQTLIVLIFPLLILSCQGTTPGTQVNNSVTHTPGETKIAVITALPTASPPLTESLQPTSAFKVASEELQDLTIQFWYDHDGISDTVLAQLINEFNTTNEWNIKVEANVKNGIDELDSEVSNAILTTGKIPDLAIGYAYQAQNWNAIRNIVLDLNPYVQDPVWGYGEDEITDFYPEFWNSDVIRVTRLGLPVWRSAKVIYYNQTWGIELGFSAPPATPEQFTEQACSAAKAQLQEVNPTSIGRGGWTISTDYSSTLAWMYAFGSNFLKPNGSGYDFNTPEVTKTFQFLRQLFENHCAWLPESQSPIVDFAARGGLFMTASIIDLPTVEYYFTQSRNPDKWVILPFPSLDNQPVITVVGPSYVIFQTSPPRELAAWLFTKWLLKPENQVKFAAAGDTLPLRRSVVQTLENSASSNALWQSAFKLIPYAKGEPPLGSWEVVRWAVGDASRQLYQWYFEADKIPSLVKLLNDTANNLHGRK